MWSDMSKITVADHGFEKGDILEVKVHNSFWKVLWHWVARKDLKRSTKYTITNVTNTEFTIDYA